MGVLKFHQVTPTGGDCCAGYEVETDRQHRNYTVRELIDIILKEKPNEWGSITVWPMVNEDDRPDYTKAKGICNYYHGEIKSKSDEKSILFFKSPPIGVYNNSSRWG